MPLDALSAVLGKLDVAELLTRAMLVCRAWPRLVDNDSTMWCRVDMTHHGDFLETEEAEAIARATVDRAAGTLEAFWADTFVTDGLLRYISERNRHIVIQLVKREVWRVLAEGEEADEMDMVDVEIVQPLLEGDVLDHDGAV